MSDKWRYVLIAIINSLLFVAFLFVYNKLGGADSNSRLIDLNFQNNSKVIFAYIGVVLGAVFSNLALMSQSHNRQLEKQKKDDPVQGYDRVNIDEHRVKEPELGEVLATTSWASVLVPLGLGLGAVAVSLLLVLRIN